MATKTTKKQPDSKPETVRSLMWLAEAGFRSFVAWTLLAHLHGIVPVVTAVYALATALLIVLVHFINAHKS